jgi:hypothetical protein
MPRAESTPGVAGIRTLGIRVDVDDIDAALCPAFIWLLMRIEHEHRKGLREALHEQVEAIRKAEQKRATEYSTTLTRIDNEIANELMAQQVSKREGDEFGYTKATRQLVQLRKDRSAVETKANQASTEASELEECHDLIDCALRDWANMKPEKRKRLVKLLMPFADMTAPSPHFIRLQCFFIVPINAVMELYVYRRHGSRHVWTPGELDTLTALFPVASKSNIMRALPDCSWQAINQKAQSKGLRRSEPYALEPALTYSDQRFMADTGARVDEAIWKMNLTALFLNSQG